MFLWTVLLIVLMSAIAYVAGRSRAAGLVVADGPLKGLEAVYLEEDGEARAMILINLLSKPHTLSYDISHLLPEK